jgi:CrcB protein
MMRLLIVMLGGALGSGARYGVNVLAARTPALPWATLAVNVLGSFLMGAIMTQALARQWSPELRLALSTGFLGGFTTYSAFSYETVMAPASVAAVNVIVTTGASLAACALGIYVTRV